MIAYGKTALGKQRWYCKYCKKTETRKRKDIVLRHREKLFKEWLLKMRPLFEIAMERGLSRESLSRRFSYFFKHPPLVPLQVKKDELLILDATQIGGRKAVVYIAATKERVRSWMFAKTENYYGWYSFIDNYLIQADYLVIDGKKGLYKAIEQLWPETIVQRCIAHIVRNAIQNLGRKPKTLAAMELRKLIVFELVKVNTETAKEKWLEDFKTWEIKYHDFLKERTYSSDPSSKRRWWYSHKRLRAVRSHINNALPYMFNYLEYPIIPRTSNHLEGGVNTRLKELLTRHRGLSLESKLALCSYYLDDKRDKR